MAVWVRDVRTATTGTFQRPLSPATSVSPNGVSKKYSTAYLGAWEAGGDSLVQSLADRRRLAAGSPQRRRPSLTCCKAGVSSFFSATGINTPCSRGVKSQDSGPGVCRLSAMCDLDGPLMRNGFEFDASTYLLHTVSVELS